MGTVLYYSIHKRKSRARNSKLLYWWIKTITSIDSGFAKIIPLKNLEFTPFVLPTLVDSEDIK